ncbi:MAG: hypothetical protein K2G87_10180 [Oscillospiraceae bacterium]|nr:hypothetical protein [Oscillospiraceae bacterium]
MLNKKFLPGIILSMAVCFSACSNENAEVTETSSESVTLAETMSAESESRSAAEPVSEPETPDTNQEDVTEATNENDTENSETGLMYYIQPVIEQYDEYDRWSLAEWECSDTEVMHGYHYGDEWKYRKELIFVFSNFTDEPVTIDSIQILRESDGTLASFADGSDTLDIDFTVQPMHRTDYILKAEDFDYSSCESGIYNAVVNVGLEGYGREFFIDNEETYTEINKDPVYGFEDQYEVPAFLSEEQREAFSKAYIIMSDWFWLEENYALKYDDIEEFIDVLSEGLTYDYAMKRALGTYIDENGEFIIKESYGSRGMDMSYYGHCFLPVSADDEQVTFKAIVTHAHSDFPYDIRFEEKDYHMVNPENGWRVDRFDIWN